jgi:hypothetical protein
MVKSWVFQDSRVAEKQEKRWDEEANKEAVSRACSRVFLSVRFGGADERDRWR